ncbi:hypothetical protein EON63_23870 [archaeon]|nr:MAG: hypothetical protein EON63_23870 [archaeon]
MKTESKSSTLIYSNIAILTLFLSSRSSKFIDKSSDPDSHDTGPNTLEAAAHEAALADGLIQSDLNGDAKSKKASLRRGKWTTEEEAYANRLIYEFKLGLLPLTDGTTLRTFLSKLLNCDPMRISKKFVGQNCIGKVRKLPCVFVCMATEVCVHVYGLYVYGLVQECMQHVSMAYGCNNVHS